MQKEGNMGFSCSITRAGCGEIFSAFCALFFQQKEQSDPLRYITAE